MGTARRTVQTLDRRWGFGSYPGSWTPPATPRVARRLTTGGFVCAVVGVLVLPIALGPVAMGLGVAAAVRGDRRGRWAVVAGAGALCLGTLLGTLVLSRG